MNSLSNLNRVKRYAQVGAFSIIAINVFLLKFTIEIISSAGGPMGISYVVLPFMLVSHLFVIPAIFELFDHKTNKIRLIINGIGICWISYVLILSLI